MEVKASRDIGDRKIRKTKVHDIGDCETPKPEILSSVVNGKEIRPKGCKEQKIPVG
jgi:hypothetical protein